MKTVSADLPAPLDEVRAYLFLIVTIQNACVLSSPIIALFVQSRWIVKHEKMSYELFVSFLISIEFTVVHFDVPCSA
jgi:hypothetical protein